MLQLWNILLFIRWTGVKRLNPAFRVTGSTPATVAVHQ